MTIRPGSPDAASSEPFQDTLRRFLAQAGGVAQGHFELFKLELGDERERLGHLLTRGLLSAFMISLTVQLSAVLAIALAWDTRWRLPVIAGLATASLVAMVLLIRSYRSTAASRLFDASADALHKDVQSLNRQP